MARDGVFDDLARGLADGTLTRGKAIRLMGAALVGGGLASFPGTAWAAKGGGGGKSSCAKYCKTLFGGDIAAQEECTAQGTKGTGPCFACGGPGKPAPTCSTNETLNTTTCQCEACTPGTPCSSGGFCYANASGTGTTCRCGDASCASSCDECSASQVCVVNDGGCSTSPFICVTPC
jgi:hypothetical protein